MGTRDLAVPRLQLAMPESPLARHMATPVELQARLAMARQGSPFVVLRLPDRTQSLVSLEGCERLTIGRRPASDISLPWDTRVSRLHAELVRVGNDWVLIDDGLSVNGTWVGETRLSGRRRLRDGDLIRVGNTLLAFCAALETPDVTSLAQDVAEVARITPAQRRVLVALCRPFVASGTPVPPTNAELAEELYLSIDSIKTHLRALFEAFELDAVPPRQKRSALVERAVRTGMVRGGE